MATSGETLRDEDRLPWLETVDEDYDEGPSALRVVLLVLLGLAVIAAAIFGYYWYQKNQGADGNGALIAAQEGDYKVKPDDPGGLKVEGEGDTAIATSDGKGGTGSTLDAKAEPEPPIATTPAAPKAPADSGASRAVVELPAASGALVQLGSFPDEASANAEWAKSTKRFAYLASLGKSVQQAEVNGRKVYRLRVNAGSAGQASELCGKLTAAGAACFVARN